MTCLDSVYSRGSSTWHQHSRHAYTSGHVAESDFPVHLIIAVACVGSPVLLQVFQLPKALAYPLFYKLVAPNSSSVTRDAILTWFEEKNVVQVRLSAAMSSLRIVMVFDALLHGCLLPGCSMCIAP